MTGGFSWVRRPVLWMALFCTLMIGVFASANPASAQTSTVTAKLVTPSGTAVNNAYAYLYNYSGASVWKYDYSDSNGIIDFTEVPEGTYTLDIYNPYPWTENSTAPRGISVTVGADTTTDLGTITFNTDNITGKIVDASGNAVSDLWISVSTSNWSEYSSKSTNSDGTFSLYAKGPGDYTMWLYDKTWSTPKFYSPGNVSISLTSAGQNYDAGTIQGKEPNVYGTFKGQSGETLSSSTYPYAYLDNRPSWTVSKYSSVDTDGRYEFYAPKGTYTLTLYAYDGNDNPEPQTVTVGDSSVNLGEIRKPSPNTTFTILETNGTTPVANASVNIHTSDWSKYKYGTTSSSGQVSFSLSTTATYYVDTWTSHTTQADPVQYSFAFTSGGTHSATLSMRTSAMKLKFVDTSGNAVSGVSVAVNDSSGSYSPGKYGYGYSDSTGMAMVRYALDSGEYTVRLSYYSWNGTQFVPPDDFTMTLTAGTTDTTYYDSPLTMTTPVKRISGTVLYSNGNPVTDGQLSMWKPTGNGWQSASTDSNGAFSVLVPNGEWNVSVYPSWSNGQPNWNYLDPAKVVKFDEARDVAETKTVEFEVTRYSSTMTGRVLRPDGTVPTSGWSTSVTVTNDKNVWGWSNIDSNGYWTVKIPKGSFKVRIYTSEANYGAPAASSWAIGEEETIDTGTATLLAKEEEIVVTTRDTDGNALPNMWVSTWMVDGYGWGSGTTDSNGQVTIPVIEGKWKVSSYGNWYGTDSVKYVALETDKEVTISDRESENVTIEFGKITSTINGSVQDTDGNIISEYGWIGVTNANSDDTWSSLGCSVSSGTFSCGVAAGSWDLKYWNWGSSYDVEGEVTVDIEDSETVNDVVLTVVPANSSISGSLVDENGEVLEGVQASVFAQKSGASYKWDWVSGGENEEYSFNVSAGSWEVDTWASWGSSYIVRPGDSKTVTVGDDEDVDHDIVLLEKDAEIEGRITDQDGNPVQNISVSLGTKKGEETTTNHNMYWGNALNFSALTDQDGNYSILTTSGEWFVSVTGTSQFGYMNPESEKVTVESDGSTTVDFVLNQSNAQVTGTVTLDGTPHQAYVYGWSEKNGFSQTTTDDGTYSLSISAPGTWYIGAIFEDPENNVYYESGDVILITETENTTYQTNLVLDQKDVEIPDAQTLTFASDDTVTMTLSNGTELFVPAFGILDEADREITLTITPRAQAPRTSDARPMNIMYDMEARYADGDTAGQTISSFAGVVTLKIPYTQAQLDELGITTEDIQPQYWSDLSETYESVSNVSLEDNGDGTGFFVFTATHFTMFGLVTGGSASSDEVAPTVNITSPLDNSTVAVPQVAVQGTASDPNSTVTVLLNGETFETPRVSSLGEFESTVTGLELGSNTLSAIATNDVGSSATVSRTVTYAIGSEADGGDGNGDNGGGDGDDTPITVPTLVGKDIVVVPHEGASNIRMFTQEGEYIRSFYAYSPAVRGSYQMLTRDIDGDGEQELLVSTENGLAPHVRVFDKEGNLITHFFPFGTTTRFGAKIAMADVTGNNLAELLVWPQGKAGPQLRIYEYDAENEEFDLIADEFLFPEAFRGTMQITVADVTGDGTKEIIAFPTEGGTSHIRMFNYENGQLELLTQFFAFGETLRVGLRVLTGDVDGDGVRDLIVAPETAAGSNIRFYRYDVNNEAFELLGWTMAFGSDWRGELNIRAADIDNDDMVEVVVAPHTNGGPNVRIYEYNPLSKQVEMVDWFMAYGEVFRGGVDFAITNLDTDDYSEIVTTPRRFGGTNLRVYEYDPDVQGFVLRDWMMTHNAGTRGQLHVTVSDIQGDGDSELIISPYEVGMGGPNVRVLEFTNKKLSVHNWFWGFAESFTGGVKATTMNE